MLSGAASPAFAGEIGVSEEEELIEKRSAVLGTHGPLREET